MARSPKKTDYERWFETTGAALREREVLARAENARRLAGIPSPEVCGPAPAQKKRKTKMSERERFYRSPEWRAVRETVFMRYARICARCMSQVNLNIDHILLRLKYRHLQLEPSNLRVLCWPCNKAKAARIEIAG